ncbi:hypothetical protein [Streptomyces rochei]|uniref:hypothetical protein n=1 Tax=Streptomyces rochei TaxID=1928 RepID=UPI0036AA9EE7
MSTKCLVVRSPLQQALQIQPSSGVLSRIADRLTASPRVDYHLRRNHLRDWAIPQADWIRIIAEVTRQQRPQHRKLTTWPTVTHTAGTIYV